jgi:hypothetical protein
LFIFISSPLIFAQGILAQAGRSAVGGGSIPSAEGIEIDIKRRDER